MRNINNPWLGLASYEEKDEYKFKGRSKDVENLRTMLHQNDCIVCYAGSGVGKSSLINAGLIPAMRRNGMFPIRIMFTTDEYNGKNIPYKDNTIDFDQLILGKINQCLEKYKQSFIETHDTNVDFAIKFNKINQYKSINAVNCLWWKLRTETIQISYGEYDYIPVLIFDQFEEIFRAKWKTEFFQWLEELMKDVYPFNNEGIIEIPNKKMFKLLFSLRHEYIGELDYWCSQRTFIPQIQKNRYFLKSMTRNQAIAVIMSQEQDDYISKKLKSESDIIVDHIIESSIFEKLDYNIDEVPTIALSLVCYVLYNEWSENETFSLNKFGLNEIIYDFYRKQLKDLAVEDCNRIVLERVLISPQKTRLRVPISDYRLQEINIQQYLNSSDNLYSRHILKSENFNGEKYVELIHDCLMEAIYKKSQQEQRAYSKKDNIKKRTRLLLKRIIILLSLILCITSYFILKPIKNLEKNKNFQWELTQDIEINQDNFDYTYDSKNHKIEVFSTPSDSDFINATKLCINIGSYKSYENVLYKDKHMINYAHNAKVIIFGTLDSIYNFNFGKDVQDVIFLHPEKIKSIHCQNDKTQIYVPYNYFEYCRKLDAFKGISFQELGPFDTLIEKISLYYKQQPNYLIVTIFYIISSIWLIIILLKLRKRIINITRFKLVTNTLIISILLFFTLLGIEYYFQLQTGYLLHIAAFIFFFSLFFLNPSIARKLSKKVNYNIIFNSITGKQESTNLKKSLIDAGFRESEIKLDLGIYRNNSINYIRLKQSITSAKHTIAILSENENNEIDDNHFFETIKTMAKKHYLIHPVIYSKDASKCINQLKKIKKGYWVKRYISHEVLMNDVESTKKLISNLKKRRWNLPLIFYFFGFSFLLWSIIVTAHFLLLILWN